MSEIEKAIQEIEDMAYHSSLKTNITTQSMCVILKVLQEKTEREKHPNCWIPVSERLPEVDKYGEAYVLVCMDDEFITTTTYVENEGFELWAESGEVVAWQYLPEPYKE